MLTDPKTASAALPEPTTELRGVAELAVELIRLSGYVDALWAEIPPDRRKKLRKRLVDGQIAAVERIARRTDRQYELRRHIVLPTRVPTQQPAVEAARHRFRAWWDWIAPFLQRDAERE